MILEVFTAEHGRVAMVARGVRGKKNALQPLLQPFRPLLISWRGRGSLYSMQQVEADGRLPALRGANLMSGFYINELLMRLLHYEESYPALYATYELLLQQLAAADVDLEWLLRQFELRLLSDMGYALNLEYEGDSGASLQAEQRYHYIFERGAISWHGGDVLGVPIHGATLLGLAQGELSDLRSRREAKRLMRTQLKYLLGEKPLHSRELMQQML